MGIETTDRCKIFIKTARHWNNVYAGSISAIEPECDSKVKQLSDMGFDSVNIYIYTYINHIFLFELTHVMHVLRFLA